MISLNDFELIGCTVYFTRKYTIATNIEIKSNITILYFKRPSAKLSSRLFGLFTTYEQV